MLAYLPTGSPSFGAATGIARILPLAAERYLGLPAAGFWPIAFIAVFLAVFFISCLLLWFIRLLDPKAMTLNALQWTIRTASCAVAWFTGMAACAGIALSVEGWLQAGSWLLFATGLFLMPFLCLRSDIVASERPPWIWGPRWPGGFAVVLLLISALASALFTVPAAMASEIETTSTRILIVILIELGGWVTGLVLTALAMGAWLSHLSWRDSSRAWRGYIRYRYLAPLAAADLSIAWLFIAVMLAPALSIALHMIYVAPEVEGHLRALKQPVPGILRGLWATARWVGEWWWLVLMVPLAWFSLAWSARIVHSVRNVYMHHDHKPAHE